MLSKADDYPVHQLPEPIATAGTDRNFYDRYFFNGYSKDGSVFFAAALGVYPHLNVMDAAFSVIAGGVQRNLHASRLLNMERMDTQVGPIAVEVIEPLKKLRVKVRANEHGIEADLVFTHRAPAVEEPRFTYRQGPRTMLDYTRLTQNGSYEGAITIRGKRIDASGFLGTRDRSWGVRPIGLGDPQGAAPPRPPQFYWLWAPLNFDDRFLLYHDNADASGKAWNTASVMGLTGEHAPVHMASCKSKLDFKSGTRHAKSAVIETTDPDGGAWRVEIAPQYNFYMSGIGYMNPDWGHGHYKGENALGYDEYETASVNESDPRFLHVQAISTAKLSGPNGVTRDGVGVLEQLIIGAHAPSGFKDIFDPAP
ncbi:MAG TPA: hypothetical protein VHU87_15625 [Rhizomicrobium sp.]|jgi:hypothetical protein|nr:hypothetical protein [Rhizomicrobium sp.]